MLSRFTLIFLLCFCFNQVSAQSFISLVKYRSGKRITIQPGEFLKVKSDGTIYKGELFQISDSNIILAHDTILDTCHLSSVEWIQYKHKGFGNSFMQGSAKSLISAGPVYAIFGLANNALADIEPIAQERNFKTAGLITLAGISWYLAVELITNKKHRIKRWKIIPNDFRNMNIR